MSYMYTTDGEIRKVPSNITFNKSTGDAEKTCEWCGRRPAEPGDTWCSTCLAAMEVDRKKAVSEYKIKLPKK